MRIGIDVDDTLNQLSVPWSKWIAKHHDPEFSLEKWTDWDLNKVTKVDLGTLQNFLSLPGVFFHVPVHKGAPEVTKMLTEQHEVYIITAFHHWEHGLKDKCQWLAANFPHIPSKNIIFCNKKSLVDVDVLIDDGAHNFNEFNGFPILMERNWNRKADIPTKAKTWWDVEKIFRNLNWLKD
jgi:5'-nucleotidase